MVDGLPSSKTSPDQGSLTSGVGPSHGRVNNFHAVLRIEKNGGVNIVADLSLYQQTHPVLHPNPPDFEPDGPWYSMVAVGGNLFAVGPNHGELDQIDAENGHIKRIADISATQGHIVPTAVAWDGDNFYVGNLGLFPITDGSSRILKITPSGHVTTFATGFTTILGLAFDCELPDVLLAHASTPGLGAPGNSSDGMQARRRGFSFAFSCIGVQNPQLRHPGSGIRVPLRRLTAKTFRSSYWRSRLNSTA